MPDEVVKRWRDARPFPGLRSFTEREAHLFFGREGQSDEIVRLLQRTGFAAVVGTSGCGKSSLVRAGLLPTLFAGYSASRGCKWRVADFRPGNNPIGNLRSALGPCFGGEADGCDWLRQGSSSLADAVRQARATGRLEPDENLLLVADQFEELFRYQVRKESATADRDEKAQFVALLLECVRPEDKLFVVITIRSDFLGDCAQFRDLPEAMNHSQYLVPRMTRQQRRCAVEGPIRVAGARIAARLTDKVLNDLGDDPDQLPVLQHALMRTWDAWVSLGKFEEPIDWDAYDTVGTVQNALGNHAEEICRRAAAKINVPAQRIIKRIFQRLRTRDSNGPAVRSSASVDELRAITEAPLSDVQAVLDCFRDDLAGCTFLTPFRSAVEVLSEDTPVDVTHESLLRCWPRLAGDWDPEEEESRRVYTRLAESAEGRGKDDFLAGSLLKRTLEWWDKQQPNEAWAARYHAGFQATKQYLFESRDAYEREQQQAREQERLEQERKIAEARQAAELHQARVKRIGASVIAVVALFAFVISTYSWLRARAARREAVVQLLASKASLAASQGDARLVPAVLLAAEAVRRSPTNQARVLLADTLALLPVPEVLPFANASALQAAFGMNGKALAILSRDGRIQVWDPATAARIAVAGSGGIRSFAFSRSAARLATAAADGQIGIWDAKTGARLATLSCPAALPVVTASADKTPVISRSTDKAPVISVSADGQAVAALCDSRLFLWSSGGTWRRPRLLRIGKPDERWTHVALGDNANLIALANARRGGSRNPDDHDRESASIVVRTVPEGKTLASDSPPKRDTRPVAPLRSVTALTLFESTRSGPSLAAADADGAVRIWNLPRVGRPAAPMPLQANNASTTFKLTAAATELSLSQDGNCLIARSTDGIAKVWDIEDEKEAVRLIGEKRVASVSMTDRSGRAVAVDDDGRLTAWNLAGLSISLGRVLAAQFSSDRARLLCRLLPPGTGVIVDLQKGNITGRWDLLDDGFYPVGIAPDGEWAAVRLKSTPPDRYGGLDMRSLSLSLGKIGQSRWAKPVSLADVIMLGYPIFSRDGRYLAGFVLQVGLGPQEQPSYLFGLFVWDAATGQELCRPPEAPRSLQTPAFAFTPDGNGVVIGSRNGGLKQIAVPGGAETALFPARNVTAVAFSEDGKLLAMGEAGTSGNSEDLSLPPRVRVLAYPSGKEIAAFDQPGSIGSIAFSNDGRYLVVCGAEVSLWEVSSRLRLLHYPARVLAACITNEGRLAVADTRGVAFLPWQPSDLVSEACKRARRSLTKEEWEFYVPNEPYTETCRSGR
jgi:WD40 repeat protein